MTTTSRLVSLAGVATLAVACNAILGLEELPRGAAGGGNGGTAAANVGDGGSQAGGKAGAAGSGALEPGGGNAGSGALEPGGGGAGGAPDSDACVGVVCDTPPGADCSTGTAFKTYDKMGSCSAGVCTYTEHVVTCSCEAGKCTTDPCIAVTCASPPGASCKDADTLTTYAASGTCSAGSCSYAPNDQACEFGCSNGACKPDPCSGKTCSTPPAASCKNASTHTTYAATGTCSAGSCSYAPTDKACGSNQQCAGAGPCAVCKADASCEAGCGACGAGTPKCKDLGTTSKCVACLSNADCSGATPNCDTATNVCEPPPSCVNDRTRACGNCSLGTQTCLNGAWGTCENNPGPPLTYYRDADGDGFGASSMSTVSCTGAPTGYVTSSTDCCDTDADARPGQTAYFATARTGHGLSNCTGSSFDYNCDGTWSRRYTNYVCSGATCTPGYVLSPPGCGESDDDFGECYVSCTPGGACSCVNQSTSITQQQTCR